ncbi:TIGR01777 family oxidoreductase [Spirabiliibacterium falconis]|uniref:TIGR01777 family oxidoreductase n=1 Tax=Spirabiliibacterium falconis TaxID=572023 RepID=UPI001AAD490E|nr:TIGR01777 family oxidoreductase [Spirabiliibacterium falconis]MBE2894060.1 TIGR01777 family protein [Spirabiliibacterium falconis]
MRIFITGATGLIGTALCQTLLAQGHRITALTRNEHHAKTHFKGLILNYCSDLTALHHFNEFDAIINLAGEPIFDKRWTVRQKRELVASRVQLTQTLVEKINASDNPPEVLISGSAIGFYGNVTQREVDEHADAGTGFAAELCQRWENAALNATCRVCLLRTSMVLATTGGALAKMLPLYKLGLGGRIGSGTQHWAWIHLEDMVNIILFLLNHSQCQGPFNCCSPHAVTNAAFNRTLAHTLRRPHFAFVPAFVLKFVLGERAQLLLDNQSIIPKQLCQAGFQFQYPKLTPALDALLAEC